MKHPMTRKIQTMMAVSALILGLSQSALAAEECPGPALGGEVSKPEKKEAVAESKAKESVKAEVKPAAKPTPMTDVELLQAHSARILGDKLSAEEMRRSILDLSGRLAIDEEGCLDSRCSEAGKLRARNYLIERSVVYGAKAYVEELREAKAPPAKINGNAKFGPLDFTTASQSFLKEVLTLGQYHSVSKLVTFGGLVRVVASKNNPQFIGIEKLQTLDLSLMQRILQIAKLNPKNSTGPLAPGFDRSWTEISEAFNFAEKPVKLSVLIEQLESLIRRMKLADEVRVDANKPIEHRLVLANVIAEIPGTTRPEEIVEIAVHYDTVKGAPGADDNGSGLANALEILRILSVNRPQRTVRVVFADLEEKGRKGTIHHVNVVRQRGDHIVGALVVDTIGFHPLRENGEKPIFVLELGTPFMRRGPERFEAANRITRYAEAQFARYTRYVRMSTELEGALPESTDLGSYVEAGIPSYLIAAPYEDDFINPGYHKPSDVIENINWLYFTSIARYVVENVAVLSGAQATMADLKALTPETMDHYMSEFTPTHPSEDHRKTIKEKGGKKTFGPGGMAGMGGMGGSFERDYDDDDGGYF